MEDGGVIGQIIAVVAHVGTSKLKCDVLAAQETELILCFGVG
jgi:hypothetical protein